MSFMDVMYGPLGSVNNQFQANLAQNAAAMGQQQNFYGQQANLGYQDQAAFNQAVDNSRGPSSGYGTVGGYPSFGEPGNYGGQNDPFSAGYAPGPRGYSGIPAPSAPSGGGGGGGGGYNPYNPWGDDPPATFDQRFDAAAPPASFDQRFGTAAPPASFNDRWGSTPYSPVYKVPDIITDGGHPSFNQRWENVPDYNPYQTPQMPGDGGMLNYSGGSSAHNPWGGVSAAEEAAMRAYATRPGQAYGPGYFDNTFGGVNSANQRDAISEQVMRNNRGNQLQSAVFGGFGAENMWRDPFANSQPPVGSLGAGGIYADPFGGFNSSTWVAPNGLSGNLAKPDYQYGGFGDYDLAPTYYGGG